VNAFFTARFAESLRAFRGVYANRDLRNVQLAFAGSVVGMYAYAIAVAVFAYEHGGVTAVGVFTFIRLGVAAVVASPAASFADRYHREHVMLTSDLARAVALGTAAVVTATHGPALIVYALATLATAVGTVFRPAESAMLPTLARSPEELTAANVSSSTLDSIGSFVGPALGALLLAIGGPATVFTMTALTFLWSASCVVRIHAPAPTPRDEGESTAETATLDELLAGVRAIRQEPRLKLLIGLYGAQTVVAGALVVLLVVTALRLLDLGSAGVGILEAASGIGSIVGAGVMLALVGRNRLAQDLAFGLVLWGIPLVLVGLVPTTVIALLAWGVVGLGNTLVDVSAITLLQRAAPFAVAARVFGVLESALFAGIALGSLLAPVLVGLAGTRVALIVTGGILPILVLLMWSQLRRIDRGAGVDEATVAALRRVPFLAPLPLATLEFLAARVAHVALAPGRTLFKEGDPGDRFYVLTSGTLEIGLPDGAKQEVAPAYVGEIALLRDVPRTATVDAVTACELLALERGDFLAAVTGHASSAGIAQDVVSLRMGAVPGPA
jgi:MFS family permease